MTFSKHLATSETLRSTLKIFLKLQKAANLASSCCWVFKNISDMCLIVFDNCVEMRQADLGHFGATFLLRELLIFLTTFESFNLALKPLEKKLILFIK